MIEFIGYLSALAFAVSGIPFAYLAWKRGQVEGVSLFRCLLILFGSLGPPIYELGTARSVPQIADFLINSICWLIVLKYVIKPRR